MTKLLFILLLLFGCETPAESEDEVNNENLIPSSLDICENEYDTVSGALIDCDNDCEEHQGECYNISDLYSLSDFRACTEQFNENTLLFDIGYQQWENGRLRILSIEELELDSLPESIGNYTYLQSLSLWNNQLTSIPDSIGNLVSLIELVLNKNNLTSFPESIIDLPNLNILHLGENSLLSIPESICNLPEDCIIPVNDNLLCEEHHFDCINNWGEQNGVYDACGICNGNGIDEDEDGICDDIDDCEGIVDECGICAGYAACYCNCNYDLDYDLDGICNENDDTMNLYGWSPFGQMLLPLEVRDMLDNDNDWSGFDYMERVGMNGYYISQDDIQCTNGLTYPCGLNQANGTYYLDYDHLGEIVENSPPQDWSILFGWDDDKDGDGNPQDLGEWGYIDILCDENGQDCELPNGGFIYTIIQPHQIWHSDDGIIEGSPLSYLGAFDNINGRWVDVGVDEYSTLIGSVFDYPINPNTVTYTVSNNSVFIDWDDLEHVAVMFYDEDNNPVYFDIFNELMSMYQVRFNVEFNTELCSINWIEGSYYIVESNYLIDGLIENQEYCFYVNSMLAPEQSFTLSDFIFCFNNE